MTRYDTVVVGAGFSGLRTARELTAAGQSVVVLEGGDRLGGRAYSRPFSGDPGLTVELGGTYIHRTFHPRITAELVRYNIPTAPAPSPRHFHHRLPQGARASSLPVPPEEALGAEATLFRILSDARRIDLSRGLENQGLDDLDIPLASYLDILASPPVTRGLLLAWGRNMMGQPAEESSALWALQFVAAHGHSLVGVVLSIDEVFACGTADLAAAMAADVPDIRLGHQVTRLRQDDDGIDVETSDGELFGADRAVVAMPFNTWRRLSFEPGLPPERIPVVQAGHGCRSLKLLVHVRGVEEGVQCLGDGVFPTLYDYCSVGERGDRLLVAFTDRTALPSTDLAAVTAAVHHYLPDAEVVGFDHHDWLADPLFEGPWVSPRVGQFSSMHRGLAARHGRIHFAGADVSLYFPGYLEGALETADRVVGEVLGTQ